MALYKLTNYIQQSNDASFDAEHTPGSATPFSAIYRCMGCNREVVSEAHKPLPPQNHHQHTPAQGPIRWKMIVYAIHTPT